MYFLNNQFINFDTDNNGIEITERGFLLGDGCFTTLRCEHGQPRYLKQHWQRLQTTAAYLQIPLPLSEQQLQDTLATLLQANNLEKTLASARITLSRGPGPRGIAPPITITPTVLITTAPLALTTADQPYRVTLSEHCRNDRSPLAAHKTINCLESICAKQQALAQGFDDALLSNTRGEIICATSANLFSLTNQTLQTPPPNSGILPGIIRQQLINAAPALGLTIIKKAFTLAALEQAQQLFITNSLIGIKPISAFNNTQYPTTSAQLHALEKTLS